MSVAHRSFQSFLEVDDGAGQLSFIRRKISPMSSLSFVPSNRLAIHSSLSRYAVRFGVLPSMRIDSQCMVFRHTRARLAAPR